MRIIPEASPLSLRYRLFIYLSLLANGIIFFHKPLFSSAYSFPYDFRTYQLPSISFLAEELSKGRFPLWDPFTYCGVPIFADIQASFFHPPVFLTALIGSQTSLDRLPMMVEWMVVLHVCFAAIVTFHLFREFGLDSPSAWAGAVIFETGGYFASRPEHIGTLMAVSFLPLAWLAVLRLRGGLNLRWLGILGLALGLSVTAGFPQATLSVFIATLLAAVLLVLLRQSPGRIIAFTMAGIGLGLCLSAAIFIPTAQLTEHSVAKYRAGWLGTGGGLYWQGLISLLYPDANHIFDLSKFKGPWDPTFLYWYGSVAGAFLAIYAVIRRRNWVVALFGIVAVFGALLMLGDKTPLWRAIYPLLPEHVRIGIHPEYTYCIFTFAMAGLAACGLNGLPIHSAFRWLVGLVIAVDLFITGASRPMNCANVREDPALTRHSFDGSEVVLNEMRRYTSMDFPPARVDSVDASLHWSQGAMISRIPTAGGISPLALENIIQLRLWLHDGFKWGWYYPVDKLDSPALDVMNVKYLLTSPAGAARVNADSRYRHLASLPGVDVFENLTVLPRFFTIDRIRRISSPDQARGVDFHQTAIVYEEVPPPSTTAQIHVDTYEPMFLALTTESSGTSFLVLSEAYYPGWHAWIDGQPTPIYLTDVAFRGVALPAGKHRVEMRFQPTILYISLGISAAALLAIAALIAFGRITPAQNAKTYS